MDSLTQTGKDDQQVADSAPSHRFSWRSKLRDAAELAWPALLGYTAVRILGLVALYTWAQSRGKGFIGLLAGSSDAGWYLRIAQNGYDMGERLQSDMAFFPLYPGLVAAIEPLSPFGHHATALGISWLAGLAAAWGLFAVGNHLYGRAAGVGLAVVWGVPLSARVS